MHAERQGNFEFIIGASLFAATMVRLYFLSTFYHALPIGKAKRVFRAFEQAAIFIFIASTYTPFTLGILHGAWGWTLLGLIWWACHGRGCTGVIR
jgi:hemolysin III